MTVRTRFRRATSGLLAAGALALVASVALAPSASAVDRGKLTFIPASGTVNAVLDMRTERGCPKGSGSSQAVLFGPGFPDYGQNLTALAPGETSIRSGFLVTTQYTLRDTASLVYPAVTYKGNYKVSVFCYRDKDGTVSAEFSGVITFSNPVSWKAAAAAAPVNAGPTESVPPVRVTPATTATSSSAPPADGASPSPSQSAGQPTPTESPLSPSAPPAESESASPEALTAAAPTAGGSSWLPLVVVGVLGVAAGSVVTLFLRRAS